MDIVKLDRRRWVNIADAAQATGRPEVTIYKAKAEDRIRWRSLAGRIVVDLDNALELWPPETTNDQEEA